MDISTEELEKDLEEETMEGETPAPEAVDTTLTDDTIATEHDQTVIADTSGESIADKSTPAPSRKRGRPPSSAHKSGPTPKKKGRQSSAITVPLSSNDEDGELFSSVVGGKSALQTVLNEWVGRYQTDPEAAMLELVQYFVRCCGCRAKILSSDFQTQEAATVIRKLTEDFAEDSGDYPLIMSGPQYKKFKSNYTEFVERLIEGCGEAILYDEYMLDTLVMWLVGLSDSQVRAFRHTSTLACLKLVTGLVRVASVVDSEVDNTQRQCETERRRSSSRRTTGKLSKLETNLQQLQQQRVNLNEMMNTLFSSVFVHRYRDTCPDIRAICIAELGVWMKEYSTQFLADNYLKYIGWTLSDKVGEVRLQSIQALLPLYSSPDLGPHLELFTEKFKERLVSMRLDKEDNVVVAAISLCSYLLSMDMLEPEECVEICELVFMENRQIARAAGKFAIQYLFSEDFMTKARRVKPPKGHKKPTDSQIKLRELVHFFLEVKIHHHAEYIVDSLWDHTTVLQEWDTMIGLLLTASCGIVLTAEEEVALIEILTCSIRRACGMSLVKGRGKALSAKDRRNVESDKESIAAELIPVIPELIAKYGTDATCAANLTSIPQQFDLELYVELRAQKHLEDLLTHLKELIQKHSSVEVLQEISKTYKHLLNTEFTLHSIVDVAFGQLVDELFASFKEWMSALKDQSLMEDDNEDIFSLSVTLKRITALLKQIDITDRSSTEDLLQLVDAGVDGNATDMLVLPALSILQLHLLWRLHSVDVTKPDRSKLRDVHTLTETLIKHCSDFLKLGSSAVQQEAFTILCDLLIVFSKQLATHGELGALVYVPDSALQSTMCDYVVERVFGDSELDTEPTSDEEALAQAEKLNDRRVLLAGYLKLILYSVIDLTMGAPIFSQYIKFFSDYGDLIRMVITRTRDASPLKWYRAILLTLQQQYLTLQSEGGGVVDHTSPEWADLKDLARRIALTTGFEVVKYRQPLVGIHRDGIKFALQRENDDDILTPPPQLDFIEVIAEFSSRLVNVDISGDKGILSFLKEQFEDHPLNEITELDGWEPLTNYISSLNRQEGTESHDTTGGVAQTKKKGRGTKRKQAVPEGEPPQLSKSTRTQSPVDVS